MITRFIEIVFLLFALLWYIHFICKRVITIRIRVNEIEKRLKQAWVKRVKPKAIEDYQDVNGVWQKVNYQQPREKDGKFTHKEWSYENLNENKEK